MKEIIILGVFFLVVLALMVAYTIFEPTEAEKLEWELEKLKKLGEE